MPHGLERHIIESCLHTYEPSVALACPSVHKNNVQLQLCPAWTNKPIGEEQEPESKEKEVLNIPLKGSKYAKITLAVAAIGLYSCREDWVAGVATLGSWKLEDILDIAVTL